MYDNVDNLFQNKYMSNIVSFFYMLLMYHSVKTVYSMTCSINSVKIWCMFDFSFIYV